MLGKLRAEQIKGGEVGEGEGEGRGMGGVGGSCTYGTIVKLEVLVINCSTNMWITKEINNYNKKHGNMFVHNDVQKN